MSCVEAQQFCSISVNRLFSLPTPHFRHPPLPPRDRALDVEVLTAGDFPARNGGSQDLFSFDSDLNAGQARAIVLEAASSKTGRLGSPAVDLDGYRAKYVCTST